MKMIMKTILAANFAVAGLSAATAANATTVNFALLRGTATVASGNFDYETGAAGILNFNNLTSFSYNDGTRSFNLAYVLGNSASTYQYLGFNTATNSFTPKNSDGYTYFLTSLASNYTTGFFTNSTGTYDYPEARANTYSSIQINGAGAVPETATWGMMIAGFGLMGAAMRNRRRSTKVSFA